MRKRHDQHKVILLFLTLLVGCGSEDSHQKLLTPVRVQTTKASQTDNPISFTATVTPYTQLNLDFKVFGYIKEIPQVEGADGRMRDVQEGDFVAKDTVLALVDEADYVAKVIEAKAQLDEARASLEKGTEDFNRAKILFSTQSITAPDYERDRKEYQVAKAQVEGALAKLGQAELSLSYCSLRTPMSAVILERKIEVGSLVRPETTGFVLGDVSSVKTLFAVPDVLLRDVQLGQELTISTESFEGSAFTGRITEIAPAANTRSRVFNVEITIPNPDNLLKPGMIASLNLSNGESDRPVILVPISSIVRSKDDPSGYALYVVEDVNGKPIARRRNVRLGSVYGNMIALYEGLQLGEHVIVTGAQMVRDGEQVRIIP